MIRVRTMGREKFGAECARLWDVAQVDFRPNLVVGIRAGGWSVAEAMRAARTPADVVFLPLICRRPSSDVKANSPAFRYLLKILPYFVLNAMRYAEYYLMTLPRCRSVRSNGGGQARIPDGIEFETIRTAAARLNSDARVLVVDDSLDSGATLATVVTLIRGVLPAGAQLRMAVFTVLGPAPVIRADYFLYSQINFRFPWSYDFHG